MGTYPVPGAMWSLYQKTYRKPVPITNAGVETPSNAKALAARSMFDPGRRPAMMPNVMPNSIHRTAAPTTSWAVTTARDSITGFSASRVWNEKPSPGQPYRSPTTRCRMKSPYCTDRGRSSPRYSLVSALARAVRFPCVNDSYGESLGGITM